MPMWKQVASKELEERGQHVDLDGLISGYGDPAKVGYMCRKCFYSYEKLLSTQATLELKVKKAIDAQAQALSEASRQNSENISARNDARHNLQLLRLQSVVTETLYSFSGSFIYPRWGRHCPGTSEILHTYNLHSYVC